MPFEGVKDTLRQIRHRRPQPVFCPKCKGKNIYPVPNYGILPTTYRCRDCGYEGAFVLELEVEDEDLERREREDNDHG
jgi:predicted RNA-binding Zn-ribbon protein involved in translation (DUF1610 family)